MRYSLVSTRCDSACRGVPIVCFAIWHWYMFRGDWLRSENGVSEAARDSMAMLDSSACVYRCGVSGPTSASGTPRMSITSSGVAAISMNTCSSGPIKIGRAHV